MLDVFRDFSPRQFLYNAEAISLLDSFKLAKKIRRSVDVQLEIDKIYDETKQPPAGSGWVREIGD